MKTSQPPALATKLLEMLAPGPHGDALTSDLAEQYRKGRSRAWYWRQAPSGIFIWLLKDRTFAGFAVIGSIFVFLLNVASVVRHPASLGSGLFLVDISSVSACALFSIWGWRQRRSEIRDALTSGAQAGMLLGLILISSHAIEWWELDRSRMMLFARGAGSTLLTLGLLSASGSLAWQRSRSITLSIMAGLWSGVLATVVLLGFAFTLNFACEAHSIAWLHQAFVASGMPDPGAFVVRNALESESEILFRLPIGGLVLALAGSFANAWVAPRSRTVLLLSACATALIFTGGAVSLWHAGSLPRAARPPFVMPGVLAAFLGACGAHPVWSSLTRKREVAAKRH